MNCQSTTFLRQWFVLHWFKVANTFLTACYNVALKVLIEIYFGELARTSVYLQVYTKSETEGLVKKANAHASHYPQK